MKLIFVSLIVTIGLSLTIPLPLQTAAEQDDAEVPDLLAYRIETDLKVYDPVTGESEEILPGWEITDFSLSPDNRIAFSSSRSGTSQVYLLDYPYAENSPVPLFLSPSSDNFQVSWSPDGRQLLIDSQGVDRGRLILWVQSRFSIIYDYHGHVNEVVWSPNGRLAFTEFSPNNLFGQDNAEIYLWDGRAAVSVSQNPSGPDRFPTWSSDGRLAFLSGRNDGSNILVWDGLSFIEEMPDITSYVSVASGLTYYGSRPIWTNTNSLAFSGPGPIELPLEIYVWDGEAVRNMSRNLFADDSGQTWRSDGYWAFISWSGRLYIRDETNRTVLKTEAHSLPAWSRNGYLVFCEYRRTSESSHWILQVWMEGKLIEVAKSNHNVFAGWNNGELTVCSNG